MPRGYRMAPRPDGTCRNHAVRQQREAGSRERRLCGPGPERSDASLHCAKLRAQLHRARRTAKAICPVRAPTLTQPLPPHRGGRGVERFRPCKQQPIARQAGRGRDPARSAGRVRGFQTQPSPNLSRPRGAGVGADELCIPIPTPPRSSAVAARGKMRTKLCGLALGDPDRDQQS